MIFLLFFANTYRGYGLFSAIRDSQPRMSQFPWVIWYLFQGSWRLTNKINQCNDTNLLHATSHLWLRVAWSSQNGLEPFQPHFLRWHEPLLHQTSGFSTGWSWSNCKSWLTNMEFSWLKLRMSFGWLVDYDHSFFILIPIPHAKKIAGVFPAKFQHKTVRTPEREEDSPFWEPFKC